MYTGVISWKLAKGLYIVPVLFAYTPILSGDWSQVLMVGFSAYSEFIYSPVRWKGAWNIDWVGGRMLRQWRELH